MSYINETGRQRVSYCLHFTDPKLKKKVLAVRTLEIDQSLYNNFSQCFSELPMPQDNTLPEDFAEMRPGIVTVMSFVRGCRDSELVEEKRYEIGENGTDIAVNPYYTSPESQGASVVAFNNRQPLAIGS
jgi:hypothetical protein